MTFGGFVPLSAINRMLKRCAAGYTIREATHRHVVTFGTLTYQLNRGSKSQSDPDIPYYDVKKMAQKLLLGPDCVNLEFPGMMKPRQPAV